MTPSEFLPPISSELQAANEDYQYFEIRPINGALGAEISGLDISEPLTSDQITEVRKALLNHQILVFRGQTLTPARLSEFGKQFGDLHINPFVEGVDGVKEVIEIRSEENNEKRFTGLWHSDISWGKTPSMGSVLYAAEIPPYGGDTLFSNMYLAYETLSPAYKKILGTLNAVHRVDQHEISTLGSKKQPEPVIHPAIRTHPETGKKALFVNEYFTSQFDGFSEEESKPILNYLFAHSTRPDFTCRIQWQQGTVVFWDNRCTMHYATNDYAGQKRRMQRVTINGDTPY